MLPRNGGPGEHHREKKSVALSLAGALLLASFGAQADPSPTTNPATGRANTAAPAAVPAPAATPAPAPATEPTNTATRTDLGPPVTELMVGQPAPYDGLLMGEERFLVYMNQEIRVDELTLTLETRERLLLKTTEELADARTADQTALAEAADAAAPGWFTRNGFVIGFVVGAIATGCLVWGAVEVLRSDPSP